MNRIGFSFDKRKTLAGMVMAVLVLLLCGAFYSWKDGLVFASLFAVAGVLKIQLRRPWAAFLLNAVWGVVCIFVTCWLPTVIVSDISCLEVGIDRILMNFLCVAVVFGVFLTITGEIKSAIAAGMIPLALMATVNGFVFQFRGNLLKPLDLFSVGTAMNVVGQYEFDIQQGMAYSWILWLWMLFVLSVLPSAKGAIPKRWLRLAAAVLTAVYTAVFLYGSRNITMFSWGNEGATRNGYFLNFAVCLRDSFVARPDNYSEETVMELENAYSDYTEPENGRRPNIIVIMNESFADFEVLGNELRTNQPVTPFLDSLEENTIRGYALASIMGGGTANSEFEFLTGFSMANLPGSSVPYQQYISHETYSLAHLLKNYGYQTFATHPFLSSGWNRTAVYPYFGFSEMTFIEDYPCQDLIREFVSDQEMYTYMLDRLDEAGEEPLFLFGITIQNHGNYSYTGDHYEQTIFLEDYEMEYPMAEQYLSLLHETDKAVEQFISELAEYPEDTVVLFFGDHFPQVEGEFFQEVHGSGFETLSEQMLQFTVPFFIWANYDIPEQTVPCTSLNYLARYLLEAAGMELPPFYRFLGDMESAIPSLNAYGYYSVSRQTYLPFDEAEGEEAAWLDRYAIMQYNGMFGSRNRSSLFWEQYRKTE